GRRAPRALRRPPRPHPRARLARVRRDRRPALHRDAGAAFLGARRPRSQPHVVGVVGRPVAAPQAVLLRRHGPHAPARRGRARARSVQPRPARDRRVPPQLGHHPPRPGERAGRVRHAGRRHAAAGALGHVQPRPPRVGRAGRDARVAGRRGGAAGAHAWARGGVRAGARRRTHALVARSRPVARTVAVPRVIRRVAILLVVFVLAFAAACGSDAASSPFVPASGTTMVLTKTVMVGTREIVLFVPAFAYDGSRAYYLFLNDGQDADALGLAVTLDDLWKKQQLPPMIVVALPVSPGGTRLQDYGTAEHDVSIACDPGGGSGLLGTQAAAYARYVIDQALPAAVREVGVAPVPARTGFLGASLGGLSAFSITWDHPETFGFAGAMSGSFWWRTMSGTVEQRQATPI